MNTEQVAAYYRYITGWPEAHCYPPHTDAERFEMARGMYYVARALQEGVDILHPHTFMIHLIQEDENEQERARVLSDLDWG